MPSHFSKYNYAICRRLSRTAIARIAAHAEPIKEDDQINSTDETSTTTNTNTTTNGKEKKNKSKKSPNKKTNVDDSENVKKLTPIDFESANEEMNNLITTLRMLNVDVIELCPDEDLVYDSVFIGDTAVIVNGLALLCRPRNRLNELKDVKQFLRMELNLPIIEIHDEEALLNGGDVLWTGREIFVGLSHETNEAGARAVAAAFPEYSVTPVKVPNKENFRLKSYITMAGPDIICVNRSQEVQSMLKRMEREASFNYKLITVEDEAASNVLYVNGTLIHRNDQAKSVDVLRDRVDYSRVPVKISELTVNHPHHGLESLCLLVRKSSRIQTIV